jgi:hypothetical protein
LRKWVTGTSFRVTQTYLSRYRPLLHRQGSVRRASGFVLVGFPDPYRLVALYTSLNSREHMMTRYLPRAATDDTSRGSGD